MSDRTRIYLDHNASSPIRPEALEAMRRCEAEGYGNPSSIHAEGRAAQKAVEEAADHVGALLGCDGSDLVFVSGGTEANNLALAGAFDGPDERGLLTSMLEHDSVLGPAEALENGGVRVQRLASNPTGTFSMEALAEGLQRSPCMVSIMAANNETGAINPIDAIGTACREKGILFHTDAAQAVGRLAIDLSASPIDLLSLSAHKLEGPKGIGALYVRKGVKVGAQIKGGPQQRGLRAGTLNAAGIVGLGEAARLAGLERETETQRQRVLIGRTWEMLKERLEGLRINGPADSAARLANTLNISVAGVSGDALHMGLDLEGVAISAGAACDAGATEPSRVLLAMGLGESDARASIRISIGRTTSEEEVREFVARTAETVERIRAC